MDKSAFTNSERERLLAYSAGIIGSAMSNPHYVAGGPTDWLIKRSIRSAAQLIDMIFDDKKLLEILSEEQKK